MSSKELRIFIDDERFPVDETLTIARSYAEAISLLAPGYQVLYVSFDHDLGSDPKTGFDFAKFLVNTDLDNNGTLLHSDFSFYVHSANPVGATNITGLLDNYIVFKSNNSC